MKRIVFACVHNAGRSQMAAAWFNALAAPEKARAISAGTTPGARVHPEVLAAMGESGIDLSGAVPEPLTAELLAGASHLVTLGCREAWPDEAWPDAPPEVVRDDWPLIDPKGKPIEIVRAIREEIRVRVGRLIAGGGWERRRPSL